MEEGVALVLAVTMAVGLVRLVRGPTEVDRMMVALLLGTSGVGLVLTLAASHPTGTGSGVALVLALLAAIGAIAFARRYSPAERRRRPDD